MLFASGHSLRAVLMIYKAVVRWRGGGEEGERSIVAARQARRRQVRLHQLDTGAKEPMLVTGRHPTEPIHVQDKTRGT